MLRFDYNEQANRTVSVRVVSEELDKSSLCGKLTLSQAEWKEIWKTLLASTEVKFINLGAKNENN